MSEAAVTVAQTLSFLVIEGESDDRETMGGLFRRSEADVVIRQIPVATLRKNLRVTVDALRSLFDEFADESHTMRLCEAQIGFEVSASGGIQLIGTAQIGAKGAITLVFRQE
jgi:hypothetical protein